MTAIVKDTKNSGNSMAFRVNQIHFELSAGVAIGKDSWVIPTTDYCSFFDRYGGFDALTKTIRPLGRLEEL